MNRPTKPIAVYGGSFDPPSKAHLELARYVAELKGLREIIFVPANQPPYDDKKVSTPFSHRLEMTRLAISGDPNFEVSDIEGKRGGMSYTIDTIREIKRERGLDTDELYLIIGEDAFAVFDKWRKPDMILSECKVVVLRRESISRDNLPERFFGRVEMLDNRIVAGSSSELRTMIGRGEDVSDILPDGVQEYIRKHDLYK